MKNIIILSALAVFAASCASQKYSRTGNITDDVYFSPRDAENTTSTSTSTEEDSDGFTYDRTPVTTNPNADYRYYQGPDPDPDTLPSSLNLTTPTYTTNNYYSYNNFGYAPYSMGMMYPVMGYSGWQMGIGFGFGYMPYCGYGYNSFYTPGYYPSYGYYQPFGYCNPWSYNPYWGNPYYNNGWNNGYPGWGGSTASTPVINGPRPSFGSPLPQTILGPNGRVRSSTPLPPVTKRPVPPAMGSNNPNLPPVLPRATGPQPQNPTRQDGERVVYPRQQYVAPAQPPRPTQPPVQRPVQRQPATPPPANAPTQQNPPVYTPQNNTPPRPPVIVQPQQDNNTPAVSPRPGRGSVNPGGGSGGTAPRRR